MALFKKGHQINNGRTPWNKGRKSPESSGEKHYEWKGEGASYYTVHQWVKRHKGETKFCEICGKRKTTFASIQWANVDHKYRRVLNDYIALCVKCHRAYDREHNS